MKESRIISRCSQGIPLKFKWFGEPGTNLKNPWDSIALAFELAINKPHRLLNDYILTSAFAEIKALIYKAELGALKSTRYIKLVDAGRDPSIFEMRWQNISVLEYIEGLGYKENRLLIRMYYSEPEKLPSVFIGHHIHEKVISTPEDTLSQQNEEIAKARLLCEQANKSF
jgi:hypothetical protein